MGAADPPLRCSGCPAQTSRARVHGRPPQPRGADGCRRCRHGCRQRRQRTYRPQEGEMLRRPRAATETRSACSRRQELADARCILLPRLGPIRSSQARELVQRPLDLSDLELQMYGSFEYPAPNQLVVAERQRRRVRGCRLYLGSRRKSRVNAEGIGRCMDPPVEDEMLIWPQGGKDRGRRGYPRARKCSLQHPPALGLVHAETLKPVEGWHKRFTWPVDSCSISLIMKRARPQPTPRLALEVAHCQHQVVPANEP